MQKKFVDTDTNLILFFDKLHSNSFGPWTYKLLYTNVHHQICNQQNLIYDTNIVLKVKGCYENFSLTSLHKFP